MDYDVLILGGGIVGCAAAYELSKYSLNIALIEKDYEIADDVAVVNSSIIYDGVECNDMLMSKLENMGNKLIYETAEKFKIPIKKLGYFLIGEDKIGEDVIEKMYKQAIHRGVENVYLLDGKDVHEMEPNLNLSVKKALFSKNTAVICPYDLAIAYAEVAFDNGVKFKLGEEVIEIKRMPKGYKVVTSKNKFTCNMVLNTTPIEDYTPDNTEKINKNISSLQYFLFEKDFKFKFNNIITTINKIDNRIYAIPTVDNKTIMALKNVEHKGSYNSIKGLSKIVGEVEEDMINAYYDDYYFNDNIIIDDSSIDNGYIKVVGKHYAQVTMTPAIAKIVCETIVSNNNCVLKKDFIDRRREFYKFRELSFEERKKIIGMDKKYGKIICVCNEVTEGEIIDAIRRPLGARTVEGIKRRTGATFGSCKGAQCLNKIASILAREIDKKMTEIVKDSKKSNLLVGRIKEFNEM